jgi:hypothetical protein
MALPLEKCTKVRIFFRWMAIPICWASIDGKVSAAFKNYLCPVPWRMLTSAH